MNSNNNNIHSMLWSIELLQWKIENNIDFTSNDYFALKFLLENFKSYLEVHNNEYKKL